MLILSPKERDLTYMTYFLVLVFVFVLVLVWFLDVIPFWFFGARVTTTLACSAYY